MTEEKDPVFELAINCANRHLSAKQFLYFYNELFNEKYGAIVNSGEETEENDKEKDIYRKLADVFLSALNCEGNVLLVEYVVEVLFVNYNSKLVSAVIPHIYSVSNKSSMIHFFTKSGAFFSRLTDKLVMDQVNEDLGTVIIPSVLSAHFNSIEQQLVVSIAKFLRSILRLSNQLIILSSTDTRDNTYMLLSRLGQINKLLYKKVADDFESKLNYENSEPNFPTDYAHNTVSPSIISPKFMHSPLTTSSRDIGKNSTTTAYQDVKLIRYYKNLWLNSKIMNWSANERDFLIKYNSIGASVCGKTTLTDQFNVDIVVTDLIETAFTCFAQFVSNKQYHQSNASFNLLERQWVVFITKQLPLLILENASKMPHTVTNALENIDDKVVKAIKSYYSDKEDTKNRNEDLFDDLPSNNLDIRHDFIKNLIMLKLQPPSILNEYLRDDQVVDIKSLPANDSVMIKNAQGVKELIEDFSQFIKSSIDALEIESIFDGLNGSVGVGNNSIIQILQSFESLAPTKQKEAANVFYDVLYESARNFDSKRLSKICCILTFNLAHSLTSILAFVSPVKFLTVIVEFLDEIWDANMSKINEGLSDETDLESNNEFSSFAYALVFAIHVSKTYGIFIGDVLLSNGHDNLQDSFVATFTTKLGDISDEIRLCTPQNFNDLLKTWVRDLFINGSISDPLMKSANVKDLAVLIPYIFKQSIMSVELGSIRDVSTLIGGFEYFLQPFLIVGLIGIVFWLEHYLTTLKSEEIPTELQQSIFEMLNSVINPAALNDESKPLHVLILRLNAIGLIKTLKFFRTQSQSNYGIYSSDVQGDPKLETLITCLENISSVANFYNIDQRMLTSNGGYSQKQLGYSPFLITNDTPISSIMTNQMNSFRNLHSSTYFNMDYLFALTDIITHERFLEDLLQSLNDNLVTSNTSISRTKGVTGEKGHVLDYIFYFLVIHDVKDSPSKINMLRYMESAEGDYETFMKDKKEPKTESEFKLEQPTDEDFDMLFGEDTSIQGNDTDIISTDNKDKDASVLPNLLLLRNSFGVILHKLKLQKERSYKAGFISKSDLNCFEEYNNKYIELLKRAVI
ncbi:LAFE_0E10264g1_1 [Lachancea fermentati]|uniref:Mediator of RNA polymerase II transcription subunit 5 n=1 Tax=Lachancea fermentati TaxID=4955 RepID=A0A1G4MDC0_LACFM|nr:LAFE_0E10264g1_1 [Lachancea fermentati]